MLASDLDGTLIPPTLDDARTAEIERFRKAVADRNLELAYVTGRDHDLAIRGIERCGLPTPDLLVCDVGTSVYVRPTHGPSFVPDEAYRVRMRDALGGANRDDVVSALGALRGLALQEARKQAEFKVSYYVDPEHAKGLRVDVPGALATFPVPPKAIWSHDPHSGRVLLDLLPRGIAKHTALEHVRAQAGYGSDEIVYAGDSGNDFDAFLSGHPAILVANTPELLKQEVRTEAETAGIIERLYFAESPFAAGVLEGCRHFGAL
ncbi:MAG: HAD-IIB family hydrolase [Gemmatimonadota bacterium]